MEIAAPQSLVGADVSRTSGYLDPILASPFRADRDGLPSTPSPAPIRVRVHPLLSFTLLRSPSCVAPAVRVATSSAFRGVSSLFATSVPRVHISAGIPSRPSFRPRRFARPRRLPPRCTWWACFIPLPRPGFSLQGFAPATQPYRLVGGRCPLVVGGGRPAEGPSLGARCPSRRPQGLAPVSRSVVPGEVVSLGQDPCPLLWFCSLGLCFVDLGDAFTSPPLSALARRSCV